MSGTGSEGNEPVTVTKDGPIRIVTLDNGEHNAVDAGMHRGLVEVWDRLRSDPGAAAVVLTGSGDTFSAGGDYAFMQAVNDPDRRWEVMEEGRRIIEGMLRFPLPVVAAVNGPAIGLGASLAVMSDLVVMADTAHLADPHVLVGLVAGDGGAATWPAHVSLLLAKEFLLLGDPVPAERAERIGLANRVVPADQVLTVSCGLARRLAAVPAHALRDTKRALNLVLEQSMAATRNYALAAERYSMGDAAHQQFLAAMAKRRDGS